MAQLNHKEQELLEWTDRFIEARRELLERLADMEVYPRSFDVKKAIILRGKGKSYREIGKIMGRTGQAIHAGLKKVKS